MTETRLTITRPRASFANRFFSLWLIAYVWIYILTSQFSPLISYSFLQHAVVWFGKVLFHFSDLQKIRFTGSGDTPFDYILVLWGAAVAFILALIVILADQKRKTYRQLYLFTIVIARYYIAYTMLVYGFVKLFHGQFGPLNYRILEEKFGNMSPMGVLWNFMKASYVYSFFGGLMEVIGGTLLLFRKTKTFGALFSMTVMINVAMLNFAYDVPVKIFSTHIVLLCCFVLSYEWIKLYNFFIAHKQEILDYNKLSVKKRWMKIVLVSFKALLIVWVFYVLFFKHLFFSHRQAVPLEGAYTTQMFICSGDTLIPDDKYNRRWDEFYIDYPASIQLIRQDSSTWYSTTTDTVKHIFSLKKQGSKDDYATFNYRLQNDTLWLTGHILNDSCIVRMTRKQKQDYPLLQRGFHWINDYPYNR